MSTISVAIKDFSRICRTCLGNEDVAPIFDIVIDDVKATDLLEYSVNLEPSRDDNLPENICEMCLKELCNIYKFKRQCHENNAVLKLLLKENEQQMRAVSPLKIENDELERLCEINDDIPAVDEEIETKTLPFQCQDCLQEFKMVDEYRTHRRKVHSCKRIHSCKLCNKVFTKSKLRQHMRSHTKEKPYQCNVCSQSFSMSGNLKRHQMTHTGERPHICSMCGKGFIQSTSLYAHEKSHQCKIGAINASNFNCEQCGRSFKRLAPYNAHLEKHAASHEIIIKKETVKREFPMADSTREHVCEICARAYKTKHLLKAHLMTHGEKKFVCDDCGKGFVTKSALQSHMRIHTGEKPYKCVLCNKSFAHVGSFDSHMLIHTGHKPYGCSQCPKSFTQLSHLKYHSRTHSGERPYACKYCGKAFALKGNLTVHERTHTGETPYVCQVCKKGFYDSSSLKKHKKNHAREEMTGQGGDFRAWEKGDEVVSSN